MRLYETVAILRFKIFYFLVNGQCLGDCVLNVNTRVVQVSGFTGTIGTNAGKTKFRIINDFAKVYRELPGYRSYYLTVVA